MTKQEYIDEAKRLFVIDAEHAWDMLHDKDKLGEVEKWDKELNKMSGSDQKSDEQTLVHWDVDLKDFLRMSYIMKTFFESFGLLEGERMTLDATKNGVLSINVYRKVLKK